MNFLRRVLRGLLEVVALAGLRRADDQRPGLGADDVVGGDDAGARVTRDVLAVDKSADRVAGAEVEDQPLVRAFAVIVAQGAGAAQDRRHLGDGRDLGRQFCARRSSCGSSPAAASASVTNAIMRS